jgi:hypothetical protein
MRGKKRGKFASFSRKERQNIPLVFAILLLLKYLLTYLTGIAEADSGKFWTLFYNGMAQAHGERGENTSL